MYNCSVFLFANSQYLSTHVLEHVLQRRKTVRLSWREDFSTESRDSDIFSVLNSNNFVRIYNDVECIPNIRDQEMKLVRQDQSSSIISSI